MSKLESSKSISKINRVSDKRKNFKGCKNNIKIINNEVKCIYFNARSIVNKQKELELIIREEDLDIIGISETWLNDKITDEELFINGYTLFRNDRNDKIKTRGGGVALYIRNELQPIHRSD